MSRACDFCGTQYDAKRPSSRFCSTKCRVANGGAPKVAKPLPKPAVDDLASELEAELVRVGRRDTTLGRQALLVARRMESAMESAVPALSRELREVRALALEGVKTEANPLDEIAARRDAKRAG